MTVNAQFNRFDLARYLFELIELMVDEAQTRPDPLHAAVQVD